MSGFGVLWLQSVRSDKLSAYSNALYRSVKITISSLYSEKTQRRDLGTSKDVGRKPRHVAISARPSDIPNMKLNVKIGVAFRVVVFGANRDM